MGRRPRIGARRPCRKPKRVIVAVLPAWIGHLRGIVTQPVQKPRAVIDAGDDIVLIGDPILLEVPRGARADTRAARTERNPRQFPIVSMPDEAIALRDAGNERFPRARGITVRKSISVIMGTFRIARGHALLHGGRDFDPMAGHLALRIVPA